MGYVFGLGFGTFEVAWEVFGGAVGACWLGEVVFF